MTLGIHKNAYKWLVTTYIKDANNFKMQIKRQYFASQVANDKKY
jgi:hypothetical protein